MLVSPPDIDQNSPYVIKQLPILPADRGLCAGMRGTAEDVLFGFCFGNSFEDI